MARENPQEIPQIAVAITKIKERINKFFLFNSKKIISIIFYKFITGYFLKTKLGKNEI